MRVKTRRMLQSGGAVIAGLAIAGSTLAATVEPARQALTINPNGQVVMTHGQLESITSSVLTVSHHGLIWTVNVAENTKLVRRFWGASKFAEFQVGDLLNIKGTLVEGQLAINANHIRNTSIREANFSGKVESVTAPDTFVVVKPDGVKRTVKVLADTVITNPKGETKAFADITVGSRVFVGGVWNRLTETVTARKVIIRSQPTPVVAPIETPAATQ